MTEPARPQQVFHTTVHPHAQAAIASTGGTFNQYNFRSAESAERYQELQELLRKIEERLDELSDRDTARDELDAITGELGNGTPNQGRVQRGLDRLKALVTSGTDLAETLARATDIVTRYWPF
ncbi:hypothetical protein Cme02nite_65220 [Catellatospora methionotrophica]|uniref:Uncharacterized protein n=1 Tax=Catellatospora methionotrophica TaxID=121620 RepID=A0A8J3LP57_9ACTN|nr:DUF5955 family protein [Catellatospora methionotrophica]GIG18190.1 hypothetical protein Cme02nite_65220 [Catellatospora methionotrophica]